MGKQSAAAAVAAPETSGLIDIASQHLIPWPGLNPRKRIPTDRVEQIAESIQEEGVLQNLVVHETHDSIRWIVAGETRWRAVSLLATRGVEILLPCSVREYSEGRALKIAMLENVHRGDLTVIEEARGFKRLIDEFGNTQEELAHEFFGDRSKQSQISNRIRLLDLPETIIAFVEDELLPWSYARDLLMPWTRREEAARDRFFAALADQLWTQQGFGGPVSRPWLTEVVERVGAVAEPRPAVAAPTPAPAPSAPSPAESAPEAAPDDRAVDEQEQPAEGNAGEEVDNELDNQVDNAVEPALPPTPVAPPAQPAAAKKTAAPAPKSSPASAAPEPAATASAVVPPIGAGRGVIPEGAGFVESVLTVTGARPCTIAVIPGANGVTVTVTPRLFKAGEKPFLLNAPTATELDAQLVPALDAHFQN